MASRIAHHIDFPDYGVDELYAISGLMLTKMGYRLAPDAEVALREYIARRITQPHFANARSVRNALDRARLRQASRLVAATGRAVSRDDLATITAADLRASRVFHA